MTAEPTPTNQQSILVVDDEPTLRFAFETTLETEGYYVESAHDGNQGLARLEAGEKFDLVLLDLRMPGMDGLEMISHVQKAGLSVPIVLASAHMDSATIAKAAFYGVVDYLKKPTTPSQLRNVVTATLTAEQQFSDFSLASSVHDCHASVALTKWLLRRRQFSKALEVIEEGLRKGTDNDSHLGAWLALCSHLCSIDKEHPCFASENFYAAVGLLDKLTLN